MHYGHTLPAVGDIKKPRKKSTSRGSQPADKRDARSAKDFVITINPMEIRYGSGQVGLGLGWGWVGVAIVVTQLNFTDVAAWGYDRTFNVTVAIAPAVSSA
jgi:hypothetical protein